jgi:hypothetical protein
MGFSLKGIVKNVGKAVAKGVKDTKNATVKAVKDTGHVTGAVVTSKVGQAVIGGALAVSGVGLPAAAAIGAASKAGGNLIKKGGNLKTAATGAYQGAALGAGAAVAGSLVRTVKDGGGLGGFGNRLLKGKDAVKPPMIGPPQREVEPVFIAEENPVLQGVTDSGIVKHDATDRMLPDSGTYPVGRNPGDRKQTPTDRFTPIVRGLLGRGGPDRQPGDDISDVTKKMSPDYNEIPTEVLYRGNGGSSPVTQESSDMPTQPATAAKTLTDNLPMLLLVGAAGVVMITVLGRQARR